MVELRFDGRVAIVTGAARGIGREHALLLARRGAAVVVTDLADEADSAGGVAAEIVQAGGTAIAHHASVATEQGARSIVEAAVAAFGRLDVVVNNAGFARPAAFPDIPVEQFQRSLDVHFLGTVMVTAAAWPHLCRAGHGRVVNTVSEGMLGTDLMTAYGAAKGAVFGFSRNLAVEAVAHDVRVNCVAPRAGTRMAEDMLAALDLPAEAIEQLKASMPAHLVAPAAAYLAHESCELNGEVLCVGSGKVSRLAVVESAGYTSADLSVEDVAAHLAQIADLGSAQPRGPLGG
ncbi:SDR family NAD(P)-dependent oxidoreductase [Nonomuraea sp. NPDC000554]|uniref:SDR family NAD(P)-dependent oxidoreductase n=1 Tax=Nonomuraea sp. NPDC000554 TaxID=3154259 RepID=UPI003326C626